MKRYKQRALMVFKRSTKPLKSMPVCVDSSCTALVPVSLRNQWARAESVVHRLDYVVSVQTHDMWYAQRKRQFKQNIRHLHPDNVHYNDGVITESRMYKFRKAVAAYHNFLTAEKEWYALYGLKPPKGNNDDDRSFR